MQQWMRGVLAAVSVAFLVSCGGGDGPGAADAVQAAPPQRSAPQRAARTVDPESFFAWAERQFRELFPEPQSTVVLSPYSYRLYSSGIAVILQGDAIFLATLNPWTIRALPYRLGDFSCLVFPENCQAATGPVVSGVAAKGLLNGATVNVYVLNDDASTGALLGTGTTGQDGSFSVTLGAQPAGPVLIEVTGGTYRSGYDGATIASQGKISAMLKAVSAGGESGVSVNPLTDMAAALARSYRTGGEALLWSIETAENWVGWQFGLRTTPTRTLPKFSVNEASTQPEGVHLALVLAALDTLGKRLSPANPDAIFASLSADMSDFYFDGVAYGGAPVALGTGTLPAGAGNSEFLKAFGVTFSGSSGGVWPGYLDAHFDRGTVVENYQAEIVPVYVAQGVARLYPARYTSPLPRTTSFDASATGYSCASGAQLTFDASGNPKCGNGASYTCWGATVVYSPSGQVSCSDGGIPEYQSAEAPVYTAPTIATYTASSIETYQAHPVIGQPAAETPAIFRATAVHLLTPAELAAMEAADAAYGAAYAAGRSSFGIPNDAQLEWMKRINDAVIASVRY